MIKIGLRVNALRSLTENTMNDCRKELGDMRDEMKHLTKLVSGLRAECKFLKMSLEKVMRTTSGGKEGRIWREKEGRGKGEEW